MQKVFKNIIENLNEERACYFLTIANTGDKSLDVAYEKVSKALDKTIKIVIQTAEQFDMEREKVVNELLKGEWVNTDDIKKYFNIGILEGLRMFEFSRTAEWNPEPLNGQKITTKFKLKNNGWIPCSERLPEIRHDCLVTVRYTGFMGMHGIWVKTGHMEAENDWWGDCSGGEVIAWKPLPEPYQQKGE